MLAPGRSACAALRRRAAHRERRRQPATSQTVDARRASRPATLTISNWPLYIDKQTVPDFEKTTGVSVKYIEDVNDNDEFFGKVQPLLDQGESGGRSIFVVTDWMANKMHELGYLQNFDKSAMPNDDKNLVPSLQQPDVRPQPRLLDAVADRA